MLQNDKNDSTYNRLILAGIKLFSQYGYDATSTRMIAQEAGVNLSAISFHFSGKEPLLTACLEFIADKTAKYYDETSKKIQILLDKGGISKSESYSYLMKIVNLQIEAAFGLQYRSSLKMIYWEQVNSMHGYHPVTTTLFEKIEKTMALLIIAVTDIPYEKAVIASRFINGSIISFGEHSRLVQYALGNEENMDQELRPWIRQEIAHYCDVVIRDLLQM
jgi:TetR/AcrR family transcriptional regulator, regulator of cefoperazone and chloramphenicol sensitivity